MTEPTFTTAEACRAAGVSMRMLNYYIAQGQVEAPPVGTGHPRSWTLNDVRRLRQCMTRVNAAKQILAEWQSGQLWRETT